MVFASTSSPGLKLFLTVWAAVHQEGVPADRLQASQVAPPQRGPSVAGFALGSGLGFQRFGNHKLDSGFTPMCLRLDARVLNTSGLDPAYAEWARSKC